jgi:hypothetical protein
MDMHLDRAGEIFWIDSLNHTFIKLQMKAFGQKKIKLHAGIKKCHFGNSMPFWQFFRNWPIGWIGHVLLVQPLKSPQWN